MSRQGKKENRRRRMLRLGAGLLGLLLTLGGYMRAEAGMLAQSPKPIGNVVVFVKFSDDATDAFNATWSNSTLTYYNWKNIKDMYGSEGKVNSFTDYIHVISEGKLSVQNFFPQEVSATDAQKAAGSYAYRVNTFTLTMREAEYDYRLNGSDGKIIEEVAAAIKDGRIPLDKQITNKGVLDGNGDGYLDNLTIIVQGDSNGAAAHKGQYGSDGASGAVQICGLSVYDYNYIPANNLISPDAGISAANAQGVIAHEFLHNFGFPDLYSTSVSNAYPVGLWDIMASNTFRLQYPLSYLRARSKVGWVSMRTVSLGERTGNSATFTLTAVSENVGDGDEKVIAFKTPLSDTELIVLEYRRKPAASAFEAYEGSIYSSGLIAYRVNEGVGESSNKGGGKNYIYVYRPGAVDPEKAIEPFAPGDSEQGSFKNHVSKAALGAGASYGSTDLNASLADDILFYSDGRNSGIRIKDVQLLENDKKVRFTVEWADYGSTGWNQTGATLSALAFGRPVFYSDNGTLYVAYKENKNSAYNINVSKWNETSGVWELLGSVSDASNFPIYSLYVKDGVPWLAYEKKTKEAAYGKIQGGRFVGGTSTGFMYASQMSFVECGGALYLECDHFAGNSYTVSLWDVAGGRKAANSDLAAGNCTNAAAATWNGAPAVLYNKDNSTKLMLYENGSWKAFPGYSGESGLMNTHILKASGGKLYALTGYSSMGETAPAIFVYDGSRWSKITLPAMTWSDMDMEIIGEDIYVAYIKNTELKIVRCRKGSTSFEDYEPLLVSGVSSLNICSSGQKLYVAYQTTGANDGVGSLVVRQKTTDSTPVQNPADPPKPPASTAYQITLTRPSGYDACPDGYSYNPVYIDGVAYQPTVQGSQCKVQLANGNSTAKVATMYYYQPSSAGDRMLPRGMRVWKLSCVNGVYSAKELTEYQDMLSYYGFSIRLSAPPGMRVCSGIKKSEREKLIAENRLVEYGTLAISASAMGNHPLVKGGAKVQQGRAYWREGSKVNDKCYRTDSDKVYFTSVLKRFPDSKAAYTMEIYFRPYAVVRHDGEELVIYGAPVSRKICQVAKQMYDKGDRSTYINKIVRVSGE